MALGFKRLEECTLQIEAVASNQWYVKFLSAEKVLYATKVTVENGNIVAYTGGINNMKISSSGFMPANRIKEENQEQRIIDEISRQQNA